jgi:SnoaL-like domain
MKPHLPPVIENYVHAINSHDPASFVSLFAADAVVDDIGREFRGTAAIKGWSDREIFEVKVTLEVIDFTNGDGEATITSKVDGTFDRTGLPDPLILVHYLTVKDDKIVRLRCRLADDKKGN